LSFTTIADPSALGRAIIAGVVTFSAANALPRIARATGSLTTAGVTPARSSSSAFALSGDGSVAAGNSGPSGGAYSAFRWTEGGGTVLLGDFSASAISHDGLVVVGSQAGPGAVRWTEATGIVPIGDANTGAGATNDDGSVVAGSFRAGPNDNHAFRWTPASGATPLGDLPGGADGSFATGVSGDGAVVIGTSESGSGSQAHAEAFRWTEADGMVGLGDLPGGALISSADGVNHDGSIIVGQSGSTASGFGGGEAFVWRQSTGMVGLGFLPNNGENPNSTAVDVTDDGSVIVGSSTSFAILNQPVDVAGEAFIWTPATGMTRLWDALLLAGVDPAADGWTLLGSGNAVSDDGLTISGEGLQNGEFRGFVAVLPEPASMTFFAAGVLSFRRRARQR
jgi:probable HAF family extracellular repeat protein